MRCYICHTKIFSKDKSFICAACRDGFVPISFSKCIPLSDGHNLNYTTLFLYDLTLKYALHQFKFRKEVRMNKLFTNLFLEHFNLLNPPDIIIPIPSHPLTNIKRGYIPMFLIAKRISEIADIPLSCSVRKYFFRSIFQNRKFQNREERISSQGNRFYIKNRNIMGIKDKKILLLDDVVTTGATLTETASLLYSNGAKEVEALILAATPI